MRTAERIARYAYRYWMRAGMTEWPELRKVAKALGIRQSEIEEHEGDRYALTAFNADDVRLGDYSVEAQTPEVEVAWCGYWLPYSHGCYCGKHTA